MKSRLILTSSKIYSHKGLIPLNVERVEAIGIKCVPVQVPPGTMRFDEDSVRDALHRITR